MYAINLPLRDYIFWTLYYKIKILTTPLDTIQVAKFSLMYIWGFVSVYISIHTHIYIYMCVYGYTIESRIYQEKIKISVLKCYIIPRKMAKSEGLVKTRVVFLCYYTGREKEGTYGAWSFTILRSTYVWPLIKYAYI